MSVSRLQRKIVERAADFGISAADVVVDPLVMPIGAINTAGKQVMHIVATPEKRAKGKHDLWRIQR